MNRANRKRVLSLISALIVLHVFAGGRCDGTGRKNRLRSSPHLYVTHPERDGPSMDAGYTDSALDVTGAGLYKDVVDGVDLTDDGCGVCCECLDVSDEGSSSERKARKKHVFKFIPRIPKFKPSLKQPVAKWEELEYLTNQDKTCRILKEGKWVRKKGELTLIPMRRERVADGLAWRFRILVALEGKQDEAITGFFKPRQRNYWDWLKEIHSYSIGRLINAPVIPTVLRFFTKKRFSWWLESVAAEEVSMLEWEGKRQPKIRGAFKYWVPSYFHRRLGRRIADEEYMNKIAASLHPANKEELKKSYPLYLDVGRGIVFDYLILNEDRPENLGTILLPDGSYKLVLIDNGLAFGVEHAGRRVMKTMFDKMRIFPKDMIDKIRKLDKNQIEKILRPPDDPIMWIPEKCVEQFFMRRRHILSRVDKYFSKWGDIIWY